MATREGLAQGAKIVLGDQDVEVTLRRLTQALAKTDLKKLLASDSELEEQMKGLMPSTSASSAMVEGGGGGNSSTAGMSKEDFTIFVETVKAKENVKLLMDNLKAIAPEIYQAMVGERDAYMANGLNQLNSYPTTVAVMGIAHVDGVERNLRDMGWVEVKKASSCSVVR